MAGQEQFSNLAGLNSLRQTAKPALTERPAHFSLRNECSLALAPSDMPQHCTNTQARKQGQPARSQPFSCKDFPLEHMQGWL